MKKIWISSLTHKQENLDLVINSLKPYQIKANWHFWLDNLPTMAWASAYNDLVNKDIGLWIIITDEQKWKTPSILKGLSGLAIMISELREDPIHILILTENFDLDDKDLPTALKDAKNFRLDIATLAVKIIAYLNSPQQKIVKDYRINFHPLNEMGLWIEVGMINQAWNGLIFGARGAEINFQTCGRRGHLPQKSTLEYPQQGLRIMYNHEEYLAWSVQNLINDDLSYFVRVNEFPEKILFTSYTNDHETDAYIIKFC